MPVAAAVAALVAGVPDPQRFAGYLNENISPGTGMPLSYNVYPKNYFDTVPDSQKRKDFTSSEKIPQCDNAEVPAAQLNAYEFETERYIASLGLNIYDGAVWCIAQSLLGNTAAARAYIANVLLPRKTFQLADIRGDAPCKGDMYSGQCDDPEGLGQCGFCYGDAAGTQSQDADHGYFFRTISDYYALEGTTDARCPDKNQWVWNDWKPILGENAWASLVGSLTTAYLAYGRSAAAIPDGSPEMQLAAQFVPTLMAMRAHTSVGTPIYYAPRNTYFHSNPDAGSSVSTENQASTLAGLKALRWVLQQKGGGAHYHLLGDVNTLISGIESYMGNSWQGSYFRQGGTWHPANSEWKWAQGDSPQFAVDCQTWVAAVLGVDFIDSRFGAGAAKKLWSTLKSTAGYAMQSNGYVRGVGYTANSYAGEVLSGEWTFGAINWLRVMAAESSYSAAEKAELTKEADYMRDALEEDLLVSTPVQKGSASRPSFLYANRRYWIPFGWWANSVPATASVGWAVAVDLNWNPLMLDGTYRSSYSGAPPPAPGPPTPPSPTPPPSPPSACGTCTAGAVCCDPTNPASVCPNQIACCDCGTSACVCPTGPSPPAPTPPPAPPAPTPPPPSSCGVCTAGATCCNPADPAQLCPGGIPCCSCGADACACTSGPTPPTPPTPSSAACSAHPNCSGLLGNCCPTDDGTMLACC